MAPGKLTPNMTPSTFLRPDVFCLSDHLRVDCGTVQYQNVSVEYFKKNARNHPTGIRY